MPNKSLNRGQKPAAGQTAKPYSLRGRRPWRVVPLAVGAVAMLCGSMAVAADLIQGVSGDRYAVEILKDKLNDIV